MIEFAGVPLCLDTPELEAWVEKNIPLIDRFISSSRLYPSVSPWAWMSSAEMPQPEIGTLYWPATASRWAIGTYIAHQYQIEKIIANIYGVEGSGQPTPQRLRLGFACEMDGPLGKGDEICTCDTMIEPRMYMMPPQALAFAGGPDDLYLLTLVDERFYWRWRPITLDQMSVSDCGKQGGQKKWAELLGELKQEIPFELPGSIDSAYQVIDSASLMSDASGFAPRTFPELLDMIAFNIGRTVVVDFDNEVSLLRNSDSDELYLSLLSELDRNGTRSRAAGWETRDMYPATLSSIIPEKFEFLFPKHHETYGFETNCDDENSSFDTISVDAAREEGNKGPADTAMRIEMAMWALMGKSGVSKNGKVRQDLADLIAEDILGRLKFSGDIVMNSIQNFENNGYLGLVEFHYNGASERCFTRIRTFPWNSYPEKYNHQDPEIPDVMKESNFATIDSDWINEGSSVSATLKSGGKIEVETLMGLPEDGLPAGSKIKVEWYTGDDCDCKWIATGAECPDEGPISDEPSADEPSADEPPADEDDPPVAPCADPEMTLFTSDGLSEIGCVNCYEVRGRSKDCECPAGERAIEDAPGYYPKGIWCAKPGVDGPGCAGEAEIPTAKRPCCPGFYLSPSIGLPVRFSKCCPGDDMYYGPHINTGEIGCWRIIK